MTQDGASRGARAAGPREALAERFAARVHASAVAHRAYRTVRREDHLWHLHRGGARHCELRADAFVRVELWRLTNRAALPWPPDARAQELLVIDGVLVAHAGSEDEIAVPPHGLALRGGAAVALHARDAAYVYVRTLRAGIEALPAIEAAWWARPRAPLQVVDPAHRRWHFAFPGVQVLPLWGTPACTSMLVRFEPGAGVPDHVHAIDEDCLMLAGSMFLGDVLLRPGDYQLAPAGGGHFGECSDVGGLFFFHGAIDPVLAATRA